jgi:AraC-like DNA-binding protein/ligand-binding sensor protein
MKAESSDNQLLETLSKSQLYCDYELAFTQATGLPLSLRQPEMMQVVRHKSRQENPFCTLLNQTKRWCADRYSLQCKLEQEAEFEAKTLKGFGGLCETAVPVRVGDKLVAFLHTGQVLLQQPDMIQFGKIASSLTEWGAVVDLKRLEEAYFNTRVLSPEQYDALIRLLTLFARQLASCVNLLMLEGRPSESAAITRARCHIRDHSCDALSLKSVAQVASMSAGYFSEQFKASTGLCFVEYVGRARVEEARHLLQDPHQRISEIAFQVGFQSLSQFNRAFKVVVGKAPTEFRADMDDVNADRGVNRVPAKRRAAGSRAAEPLALARL